ncbi:carbonic anhydrase 15-like [Tachyglossus aculeatus]|uniref:carbonic anhydrase 15-like n=1 Tax=Tachyglossus aculeatus TaxID=9261 RepID=UPI0018F58997|nr:carbonic anhydrase 15-like [Tachyglossus aculeatus]
MKTLQVLLTCLTLPLVSRPASGGSWCYDSQDPKCGPAHWKDIAKGCSGDAQSPIDIDRTKVRRDGALGPLLFQDYDTAPPGKWRLMNNGHTVMLSLEGALGTPQIAGPGLSDPYRALQLHFHWGSATGDGSEHTVDGRRHAMEMHVVHVNARYRNLEEAKGQRDGLAVLGFLFRVRTGATLG